VYLEDQHIEVGARVAKFSADTVLCSTPDARLLTDSVAPPGSASPNTGSMDSSVSLRCSEVGVLTLRLMWRPGWPTFWSI
jgi:hypothetical protein